MNAKLKVLLFGALMYALTIAPAYAWPLDILK